ncbi:DUF5995 family protein [Lutibacter citreus]|uniref:DUF5995 family protein n=1 Tax=Lutibacter citreus TaxID=2138210 RepID=UPI000DBE3B8C|nr:DUF5995 family protein [Lutibacter citreus]
MSRATTIKEVINQLDVIIENAIESNDRLGLFAYIYRRTTAEIARETKLRNFQNNERLEILDVAFANLYLDAYNDYKNNKQVSASWQFAFNQRDMPLTILQHIMLGMNAHINLDLSVSTAQTMKGIEINEVETDFNKVNDILFQITNELQERLSRVSPLMFLLDLLGENKDEQVIDFSMRKARELSWNSANLLWALGDNDNKKAIQKIDNLVLKIAERIKAPKTRTMRFILKIMKRFEKKNVGLIISRLKED